jgi:hypothetical protein
VKLETEIESVLLNQWDPIGVKNNPHAKAEYNQYALRVLGMIQSRKTESEVFNYLISVVKNDLELQPNEARTRDVVRRLFEVVSAN